PGFPPDFAALTTDGARALAEMGVRLFGTDAPSVDPVASRTLEAHHALRRAGIAILEGLALAAVPAGEDELIALPLRWRGVDAAARGGRGWGAGASRAARLKREGAMDAVESPSTRELSILREPRVFLVGRQTVDEDGVDRFLAEHQLTWQTDTTVGAEALAEM